MEKTEITRINQEKLFDQFADNYDLLIDNWRNYSKKQGNLLKHLFDKYAQRQVHTVLDCTCGIGTQCLGLANIGYKLTGTDISSKSLLRAIKEAEQLGVEIEFKKVDIRFLNQVIKKKFDAVISCDNSLPALLKKSDLILGLKNMFEYLESSGICIISIRNYDKIFSEKKKFHPRQIHKMDDGRLIVFDVWDYRNDEFVIFNVFYLSERKSGLDVTCRKMVYRAVYKDDFIGILKRVGFSNIKVLNHLNNLKLDFDFYICSKK